MRLSRTRACWRPRAYAIGSRVGEAAAEVRKCRTSRASCAVNAAWSWGSPITARSAWGIAKACRGHGAELAFTYQGDALKKRVEPLAQEVGGIVVGDCDVTEPATIDAAFAKLQAAWGTHRFRGARHRVLRQGSARRPLRRHHGRQFHQDHADQLLFVHRDRAARREDDAERRRHADADLLRLGEVDAAL